MPPADARLVFRIGECAVIDQHIRPGYQPDKLRVQAVRRVLGIRDVAHARTAPTDAVANRVPRVTQCDRADKQFRIQRDIASGDEIMVFDLRPECRIQVGHQRLLPTAPQRRGNPVRRDKMTAPESQMRPPVIHGREERQPADVIEMRVTQQNIGVHRHTGSGQRNAEFSQSAASIEDQQMRAAPQLDTERVAAIAHCCGSRRGQAASHAPEPQGHAAAMLACGQIGTLACHQCRSLCFGSSRRLQRSPGRGRARIATNRRFASHIVLPAAQSDPAGWSFVTPGLAVPGEPGGKALVAAGQTWLRSVPAVDAMWHHADRSRTTCRLPRAVITNLYRDKRLPIAAVLAAYPGIGTTGVSQRADPLATDAVRRRQPGGVHGDTTNGPRARPNTGLCQHTGQTVRTRHPRAERRVLRVAARQRRTSLLPGAARVVGLRPRHLGPTPRPRPAPEL